MIVVAAGVGADALALLGKRVTLTKWCFLHAIYEAHRGPEPGCKLRQLPDDETALQGASVFVNPLTAVGFLDTVQQNGRKPSCALLQDLSASDVGQVRR